MLVWSDNLACRLLLLPGPPHIHAGAISQHRLCLRSFTLGQSGSRSKRVMIRLSNAEFFVFTLGQSGGRLKRNDYSP